MGQFGAILDQLRANLDQLGIHLGPTWANLVPTWANLAPTWGPLGPIWAPFGPHLGQLEANLGLIPCFLDSTSPILVIRHVSTFLNRIVLLCIYIACILFLLLAYRSTTCGMFLFDCLFNFLLRVLHLSRSPGSAARAVRPLQYSTDGGHSRGKTDSGSNRWCWMVMDGNRW